MLQPAANLTMADRYQYKAALVTALAKDGGDFHVVAQLPIGRSRAALEDALYAWAARIDHHYLGRSWSAPHRRPDRMRGVVFFETSGGNDHAHLVVTAPATAAPQSAGMQDILQPIAVDDDCSSPSRKECTLFRMPRCTVRFRTGSSASPSAESALRSTSAMS